MRTLAIVAFGIGVVWGIYWLVRARPSSTEDRYVRAGYRITAIGGMLGAHVVGNALLAFTQ